MIFIGIDPGLKGGISILDLGSEELPTREIVPILHRMPTTKEPTSTGENTVIDVHALDDLLRTYALDEGVEIWYEHLWDFGSAALGTGGNQFAKAAGYGDIRATVKLSKLTCAKAAPKSWQGALGCPKFSKDDAGYKARKQWLIAKAIELYPKAQFIPKRCRVPQDGLTDSTLIAHYGALRRYMEKFGGKKRR